uniref:Uncharacterized protein n=1 Tax=Anguilla anguilla TaxID=7936 RepID=A0A0E9T6X3_ANGAN
MSPARQVCKYKTD